jgi:hypothetical protein
LLQNRLLSSDQVARGALYDHDDFECVAAGGKGGKFDLGAEDVRKVSRSSRMLSGRSTGMRWIGKLVVADRLDIGTMGKGTGS